MSELTLLEAINDCFHVELGRDENVLVMGEDVQPVHAQPRHPVPDRLVGERLRTRLRLDGR